MHSCWPTRSPPLLAPQRRAPLPIGELRALPLPRPRVVADISLIRLATPAILNNGVQFACLPVDETEAARVVRHENLREALNGEKVVVIGWGKTNPVGSGKL